MKTIDELQEEKRIFQTKLAIIEQKKVELIEQEVEMRTILKQLDNRIERLVKANSKTPDNG